MSDVHKFLFAGVFVAVSVTAAAADICKIVKWENTIGVLSGKDLLVTTSEKMNYSISSFQVDKKVYMYAAGFSCYEQGVKEPCRESNTPEGKCTELRADARDGKIFWQVKYQWRNMDVVRTIETGDFPGFKLTYDFEVTRDFQPRRIYLYFRMPARNLYTRTGYMKGGVIQFRPVKKAEWFGILRSKNFPCISFSGDTVKEGVMIAAGDMASWNRLPAVLLYSTSETCYSTVEFVYQFGKELKKGEKHSVSAFIMPINADAAAADMQENFLKLKDRIK